MHISKIRSLTLDDLDPEEYNLLKRIGALSSDRDYHCYSILIVVYVYLYILIWR